MSIKEHPPQPSAESSADVLHVPVLLDAVLRELQPAKGESYLDLTAGYGGHAGAIIEQTGNFEGAVLVDRDAYAIAHLSSFAENGATLLHTDFLSAAKQLIEEGRTFDVLLVDLGVSSPQLDQGERGFSLKHDGPLDMRMDTSQGRTAERLVNYASRDEMVGILTKYGEESVAQARRIATAMYNARPITTTKQLADVVLSIHRGKWQKTHPATRTFQALRIAVNDELRLIEDLLPLLPKLLNPGGRVGIISFHSLEDRLVKRYFKEQHDAGYESELQTTTKKAISGATEDVHNPRSRSAQLRVAVKNKNQK